jgi:hypothetical protein
MKAIETTATITENGQLILDIPLSLAINRRVRVIILIDEDEDENPDNTPMTSSRAQIIE